ncbi:MAG: TIGR04282 family arsenosugar biosynthesis glycosyltransferase [Mycobacteriales bacterium]
MTASLVATDTVTLAVLAKAPVPGKVKTRLCPPCTPDQAAALAAAALADTLAAAALAPVARRLLVLAGETDGGWPPDWDVIPQRGEDHGTRLAHAYADAEGPTVLIGMDTPQVTAELLATAVGALQHHDAVLGLAEDGGWWLMGVRDPAAAAVLTDVPMSTPDTGRLTIEALQSQALRVASVPALRDVDTFPDALAVATAAPHTRFARALRKATP